MRTKQVFSVWLAASLFAIGVSLPIQASAKNYEGIFKGNLQYYNGIPGYGLSGAGNAPFTFDFVFSDPANSDDTFLYGGIPDPVRNITLTVNGVRQTIHGDFYITVGKGILSSSIGPYSFFQIYGFINATSDDFQMSVGQFNTDFGGPQLNRPFSTIGPFDDFLGIAGDENGQVFLATSIDYVSVAGVGDPVPPPGPPIYWTYPGTLGTPLAAPEPAGWVLMIAGIGAIGAALRRRCDFREGSRSLAIIPVAGGAR